jgi:hypothetical protein
MLCLFVSAEENMEKVARMPFVALAERSLLKSAIR